MTNCTQISTSSFNIFQYNMKTVLVDTIYYVHIDVWEFRRIKCDINIPVHWPFIQEIFFGKHFYCNQSLWQYLILDVTTTHLASWHIWYWTDSSSSVLKEMITIRWTILSKIFPPLYAYASSTHSMKWELLLF